MKRVIPWIIAVAAIIAFGASFLELQRVRGRFGEVTRFQDNNHTLYREFVIRAELARADNPIIVIGDSIIEKAPLPGSVCGHPVVNAGIGGASTSYFIRLAPTLFKEATKPYLIVVALGANDIWSGSVARDFSALLAQLSSLTSRIIAVANTSDEIVLSQQRSTTNAAHVPFVEARVTGLLPDRIHFTHEGYEQWIPAIFHEVSDQCRSAELAP